MLYLLPTRSARRYTGKRPNAIHSFSGGSKSYDKDGNRCVHWETNAGERYTCTLDRFEELNSYQGFAGKLFTDLLKNGTVVNIMTQTEYDEWLGRVRAEREAARREKAHG